MTFEMVLAAALALPATWVERDLDTGREARMRDVATAVWKVTQDPLEVAVLLRLGHEETTFSHYALNNCLPYQPERYTGHCDRDKDGNPRARGFWQLWKRSCPALFKNPKDPILVGARCALRRFRGASSVCRKRGVADRLQAGFAGYRSALWCTWPPAVLRARRTRALRKKFY